MNNAFLSLELDSTPREDIQPKLQEEEARLIKIIEAIQGINSSKEWSTLKTEVFDNLTNILEKDLRMEAKKENPSLSKLNRLSGEITWAERYSDLFKLENVYRVQLQNVRLQLHGKIAE